jgi:lysophospholipase L1-like esterase
MLGAMALGAALLAATAAPSLPAAGPEVVVAHFGDSTCSTDYLPAGQRVDAVLNGLLTARYPAQRIVNRNVCKSGEWIRSFVDSGRYARVRARVPRVDVALVRYGQNDMKYYPPEEFRSQLAELCDALAADYPGVHLVLETNTWVDPAHGGFERANTKFERYWEEIRALARERGYPLVDVAARRRREIARGNWDFSIRNKELAQKRYGRWILDDGKDAEMAGVPHWFKDTHPNVRGVRLVADEELRTLTTRWPEALPRAAPPAAAR